MAVASVIKTHEGNPVLDMVTIFFLAVATFSGLYTLHRNHEFFSIYRFRDLVSLRCDAVLYVTVVSSTAMCFADMVLRTQWATQVGWDSTADGWALKWLFMHIGFSVVTTSFHILANRLLSHEKFCQLCRREF